jgi:hypothetical protein
VEDALAGGGSDVYAYVVAVGVVGGFRGMVHGESFSGFWRWCQAGWYSVVVEGPDRAG